MAGASVSGDVTQQMLLAAVEQVPLARRASAASPTLILAASESESVPRTRRKSSKRPSQLSSTLSCPTTTPSEVGELVPLTADCHTALSGSEVPLPWENLHLKAAPAPVRPSSLSASASGHGSAAVVSLWTGPGSTRTVLQPVPLSTPESVTAPSPTRTSSTTSGAAAAPDATINLKPNTASGGSVSRSARVTLAASGSGSTRMSREHNNLNLKSESVSEGTQALSTLRSGIDVHGTAAEIEQLPTTGSPTASEPLQVVTFDGRRGKKGKARSRIHVKLKWTRSCAAIAHVLVSKVTTVVYAGVIDYNHLETAFLTTSIVILMLGMVFTSQGFPAGSVGYDILTAVAVVIIVLSTAVFMSLLAFEVYRSLKFSALNDAARQLEVDQIEESLKLRRRSTMTGTQVNGRRDSSLKPGTPTSSTGSAAGRRRSRNSVVFASSLPPSLDTLVTEPAT